MDEDEFWNIQLKGHSFPPCRDWFAPQERKESVEDEHAPPEESFQRSYTQMILPWKVKDLNVSIQIRSVHPASIMDSHVGEEIWDAAIIFSAYLLSSLDVLESPSTPNYFHKMNGGTIQGKKVLELGSGVGMLGITAAFFAESIVCTDYLNDVLQNLAFNIERNREMIQLCNPAGTIQSCHLDWSYFLAEDLLKASWMMDGSTDMSLVDRKDNHHRDQDHLLPNILLSHADILIGSALVYSIQGAYFCADTIATFLSSGDNKEAWVLQVFSRPGFDRFLMRLQDRGFVYTQYPIGEREYHLASSMAVGGLKTPRDQFGLFLIQRPS